MRKCSRIRKRRLERQDEKEKREEEGGDIRRKRETRNRSRVGKKGAESRRVTGGIQQ